MRDSQSQDDEENESGLYFSRVQLLQAERDFMEMKLRRCQVHQAALSKETQVRSVTPVLDDL